MNTRIQEIENTISKASEAYYLQAAPIMSDKDFDDLCEELRDIDPNNVLLSQVGFGIHLQTYGNKKPLPITIRKSLDKVRKEFVQSLGSIELKISPKIDGMSVILEYREGVLFQALTRGDGIQGIDITQKAHLFKKLPQKLLSKHSGILRGELYLDNRTFETEFSEEYKNPRNAVAGFVNSKSLEHCDKISFYLHPEPDNLYSETHVLLKDGFDFFHFSGKADSLWQECEGLIKNSNMMWSCKQRYPIDGWVIEWGDEIKAYKTETLEVITTVRDIKWNPTNNGKLIPNISYDPVELYGTTCTKCSGFNYQFIMDNRVFPGAKIKITKANEIIPYIVSVEVPEGYVAKGVHLQRSVEPLKRLEAFLKHQFEFEGFKRGEVISYGHETVDSFLDLLVNDPSVFEVATIAVLQEFGIKSKAEKIVWNVLKKDLTLNNFFSQFAIDGIGSRQALKLDPYIDTILNLSSEDRKNFLEGLLIPKNVVEALIDEDTISVIRDIYYALQDRFVYIEASTVVDKRIVITGSLSRSKNEYAKLLSQKNVLVLPSMAKDVDFLVCNDSNSSSSKMKYAKKFNIPVITEDQMVSMFL